MFFLFWVLGSYIWFMNVKRKQLLTKTWQAQSVQWGNDAKEWSQTLSAAQWISVHKHHVRWIIFPWASALRGLSIPCSLGCVLFDLICANSCVSDLLLPQHYNGSAQTDLSDAKENVNGLGSLEFSLNVFTEFAEFSDKNNIFLKKGSNSLSPV